MAIPRTETPHPGVRTPNLDSKRSAEEAPPERSFSDLFHRLSGEIDRGERTFQSVAHGGTGPLGTSDLLTLQAQVYRYSESIDLAAKLVDRGANGIKTLLTGQ